LVQVNQPKGQSEVLPSFFARTRCCRWHSGFFPSVACIERGAGDGEGVAACTDANLILPPLPPPAAKLPLCGLRCVARAAAVWLAPPPPNAVCPPYSPAANLPTVKSPPVRCDGGVAPNSRAASPTSLKG
jgi:hypothetical protein